MRAFFAGIVVAIACGVACTGASAATSPGRASAGAAARTHFALNAPANGAPPVGHVWVIMLENHSYAENFGSLAQRSPGMSYLAKTLPSQGAVLHNYFGITHPSEANYTAMISGQPPNIGTAPDSRCPIVGLIGISACLGTQIDCPYFTPFANGNPNPPVTDLGVAIGQGCVYPSSVKDIGTQLKEASPSPSVKAYVEDMGVPCRHPSVGAFDPAGYEASPGYEAGDNPFMYFRSWIDNPDFCQAHDVSLDRNSFAPLVHDLQSVATTPNLNYIQPDLCDSGHDNCPGFGPPDSATRRSDSSFFGGATICRGDPSSSEACNSQTSQWLSWVIPKIQSSPAYRQDGLIVIMWDEANFYNSSPYIDYTSCCNEGNEAGGSGTADVTGNVLGINVTPGLIPAVLGGTGGDGGGIDAAAFAKYLLNPFGNVNDPSLLAYPGGGDSGAALLSPFIKGGTTTDTYYDHYSLLKTLQDIFAVPHTGNSGDPSGYMRSFGSDVFNNVPALARGSGCVGGCGEGLDGGTFSTLAVAGRHRGTGMLTVTGFRRHEGDALVFSVKCTARLCTGDLTLSNPRRGRGVPRLLGERHSYTYLGDRTRDLTVYLLPPALRYLHRHPHGRIVITTMNDGRHGKRARRMTLMLNLPRRRYVAVRHIPIPGAVGLRGAPGVGGR